MLYVRVGDVVERVTTVRLAVTEDNSAGAADVFCLVQITIDACGLNVRLRLPSAVRDVGRVLGIVTDDRRFVATLVLQV